MDYDVPLAFLDLEEAYLQAASAGELDRAEFLRQARNFLARGRLRASGYRNGWDERAYISHNVWVVYRLVFEGGGCAIRDTGNADSLCFNTVDNARHAPFAWTSIRLSRDDVVALWPHTAIRDDSPAQAVAPSNSDLKIFLATVGACNEDVVWREAEKHYGVLFTRQQIRDARSVKGKPGRRRTRKNPAARTAPAATFPNK